MIKQTQYEREAEVSAHKSNRYDLIVIGAGPAGMSAALCAARSKMTVLLIDKALPGGEASTAYRVDNYLGFPKGIMGIDLVQKMEAHLDDFDIDFDCGVVEDVHSLGPLDKQVRTQLGNIYQSKTIILATGLEPKPLNKPFEKQFLGRGISYYAQSDGSSYQGQNLAVIGGGNCACYAAEYLSTYAEKVYLIHSSGHLKAVKSLEDSILSNPRIHPLWNSEVSEIFGVDRVEKINVYNQSTGQKTWLDVKAIFAYVGRTPPSEILNLELEYDSDGYLITDECMRTNLPGIFAAGDGRSKQIRQIATAVSDGMIAAINAGRDIARG